MLPLPNAKLPTANYDASYVGYSYRYAKTIVILYGVCMAGCILAAVAMAFLHEPTGLIAFTSLAGQFGATLARSPITAFQGIDAPRNPDTLKGGSGAAGDQPLTVKGPLILNQTGDNANGATNSADKDDNTATDSLRPFAEGEGSTGTPRA